MKHLAFTLLMTAFSWGGDWEEIYGLEEKQAPPASTWEAGVFRMPSEQAYASSNLTHSWTIPNAQSQWRWSPYGFAAQGLDSTQSRSLEIGLPLHYGKDGFFARLNPWLLLGWGALADDFGLDATIGHGISWQERGWSEAALKAGWTNLDNQSLELSLYTEYGWSGRYAWHGPTLSATIPILGVEENQVNASYLMLASFQDNRWSLRSEVGYSLARFTRGVWGSAALGFHW